VKQTTHIRIAKIIFAIGAGKPKGRIPQMAQTLSNEKYYSASISYQTESGRVAKVDGVPIWESSDPAVFEIKNVSADGLSAEIWPADAADGVAELKITADADLGAGVTQIVTPVGIECRPAQAVAGTVTFGEGVAKP
jgi:hypothetical protein